MVLMNVLVMVLTTTVVLVLMGVVLSPYVGCSGSINLQEHQWQHLEPDTMTSHCCKSVGGSMCMCTQIRWCTNTQIHWYTNTKLHIFQKCILAKWLLHYTVLFTLDITYWQRQIHSDHPSSSPSTDRGRDLYFIIVCLFVSKTLKYITILFRLRCDINFIHTSE